jgi:hypothetical protein
MSLFLALAIAAQTSSLATPPADPASAAAVMIPVNATFAALAARDAGLLTPHLDPEARMTVAIAGPDGAATIRRLTGEAFTAGLRPGPERLEEVMPDPIIAVDGDVAMVFGRYVFRVDGAISHCGANHFDMVRRDGRWLIAGITWSQRTTGCE